MRYEDTGTYVAVLGTTSDADLQLARAGNYLPEKEARKYFDTELDHKLYG